MVPVTANMDLAIPGCLPLPRSTLRPGQHLLHTRHLLMAQEHLTGETLATMIVSNVSQYHLSSRQTWQFYHILQNVSRHMVLYQPRIKPQQPQTLVEVLGLAPHIQ
jgi:hypothetical protein